MEQLCLNLTRAFQEEAFLQKLARPRAEALFEDLDWPALLAPLAPIEERISCEKALEAFRPVLDGLAPEPGEGWALCAYRTAVSLLYPRRTRTTPPPSGTGPCASFNSCGPSSTRSGRPCPLTSGWTSPSARKRN